MADFFIKYTLILSCYRAFFCDSTKLEFLACGMDSAAKVTEGTVPVSKYPWLGILYYTNTDEQLDERATTMAVMVQRHYALVPSFDITNIPRGKLRTNTRVMFGIGWVTDNVGLPVDSFTLHPEYTSRTINTLALVKFEDNFGGYSFPVCPPITAHPLNQSIFSVIVKDVMKITKTVRKMVLINKSACKAYDKKHKLLFRKVQPTKFVCAVASSEKSACVWEAGSALVSRDPWGRWRLVGFGVRGPGCGAPAKFIDVFRYLAWMERTMSSKGYITILRTAPNQLVLRQNEEWDEHIDIPLTRTQNYIGACFDANAVQLTEIFTEISLLQCDALRTLKGQYRMKITQIVNVMCVSITTEEVESVSQPRLWIEHFCERDATMCHVYRNTTNTLDVSFLFTFRMQLIVSFSGQRFLGNYDHPSVALPVAEEARKHEINRTIQSFSN